MRVTLLATFLLLLLPASALAQAEFERLGLLPGNGTNSYALGVSADGSAIAGYSETSTTTFNGFRWTAALGMENTLDLPGAEDKSFNNAISPDGGSCAGGSRTQDDSYWQVHATLFDGTGLLDLGTVPLVSDGWSIANDLSNLGEYVVGYAVDDIGATRAFVWSQADGMSALALPTGYTSSIARSIYPDGSLIVGQMGGWMQTTQAFRWTEANGVEGIGGRMAHGISPDGSMILGISNGIAAWWTEADGWVELQWGAWGDEMGALAASSDHQVILGRDGYHAYYWTPEGGTRWLEDVLAVEHGVDLGGWVPLLIGGMSDDGTVISGSAYELADTNHWEAFRCVVPRTTWERLGYAMGGYAGVEPQLYGRGDVAAGGNGYLRVEAAPRLAPVLFIVGASAIYLPLFKGTLVPSLDLIVGAQAGWYGEVTIGGALPADLPAGIEFYAQAWILDPGAPKGFSATNAMKGVTQ